MPADTARARGDTPLAESVHHPVAVRPLPEDVLAVVFGHPLDDLGHSSVRLEQVAEVQHPLLEAALRRVLLRDPAVDSRDARPEDGAQRHEVGVRGAVHLAALEVVRAQEARGRADGVHLRCGGGVVVVEHRAARLGDDLPVLHDHGAEGLPLLGDAVEHATLGAADGAAHELLVEARRERPVHLLRRGEELLVGPLELLAGGVVEAPLQGLVDARVREERPALVPEDAVEDLDHGFLLGLALLRLAAPAVAGRAALVVDAADAEDVDAIIVRLVVDLLVEDLVVEPVLRRSVAVGADVGLVEPRPLHGAPAHRAGLARGVDVAV
mmetsp:Transcript_101177/g.286837  ORF Transcript_101177/g.286837 Transcript_101177/m.286837 type:complete len:325 (+) Transcript_101177:36-1010(+)